MDNVSFANNPDSWERSWQLQLERTYPAHRKTVRSRFAGLPVSHPLRMGVPVEEGQIQTNTNTHRRVRVMQKDLAEKYRYHCANDDFEARWLGSSAEERKRHYMKAMHVLVVMDLAYHRGYIPEITLEKMQARGGRGYLDFASGIQPHPSNDQYAYMPNSLVESFYEIKMPFRTYNEHPADPFLFAQKGMMLRRHEVIARVAWNILASFYNQDIVTAVHRHGGEDRHLGKGGRSALAERFGLSEEFYAAHQQFKRQAQKECFRCKIAGEDMQGGLKRCTKCNAIGRVVLYCSRECQMQDWRAGNPPHKSVCGKPTVLTSETDEGSTL